MSERANSFCLIGSITSLVVDSKTGPNFVLANLAISHGLKKHSWPVRENSMKYS